MNSKITTHDPVYQAILQTHTDSLKRYLSLAPSIGHTPETSPQRKKNLTPQYTQDFLPTSTSKYTE